MSEARVLIVDDSAANRFAAKQCLGRMGVSVVEVSNGREALTTLQEREVDLVLLDIQMPEMNGHEVLEHLKQSETLRHLPVLVISAVDEVDSVVKCLAAGADDYLTKPFNPTILAARVDACLEKKRLRDQEIRIMQELVKERERSDQLLLNVLPATIAERLKAGDTTIAESFSDATVLYAEIVDNADLTQTKSPTEVVHILNDVFSAFDTLAEAHGVEKLKTIGDAYVGVAGVPLQRDDHAQAVADMALGMQRECVRVFSAVGTSGSLKIGISTGPVVGGVIGRSKFSYDVWGKTAKVAVFMGIYGVAGSIQVSENTYRRLQVQYLFEDRGSFYVEGQGEVNIYLLTGKR
jgi:adenylate cyclase